MLIFILSRGCLNVFVLQAVQNWLVDEANDKRKIHGCPEITKSNWKLQHCKDVPQQSNGYDCGVFVCMYCDYMSDDLQPKFGQEKMPQFREKICASILRGSLNYPIDI